MSNQMRRMVGLAAPFAVSNVIGLGAQLVVIGMVGRIGDDALYLRSVYMPAAFLFLAVQVGLGATTQVATARCVGRGDRDAIAGNLGSLARIGLLAYAAVGALLVAAASGPVLGVTPEHRVELALFVLAMAAAGLFALAGELCAATLRGMGVGSAAIVLTSIFAAINIAVVAALGFGVRTGLSAVPVGLAVAGAANLVIGLVMLHRKGIVGRWAPWRPDMLTLVRVIGLPVGGSYLVLFVVNTVMLRIVASDGEYAVAGFASGYLLQTAVIVPGIGFGSAIAVLMNQQRAAGEAALAMATYRRGVVLVVGCYAVVTAALVIAGRRLAEPLSANPEIVAEAARYLAVVGPTFGATAVVLAVTTVLEHTGRGPIALGATIGYFALIVAIGAWAVAATGDVTALYRTIAVAAAISAITAPPIVWYALSARDRQRQPSAAGS
ncbi:MATE family efflux transporter [Actinokineospora sp.]|uniref:MATE family efflux transporter n=1 Tax=Actinokineospora sp. TaxID=1872133 RepID=UPI00403779EB